MERLNANTVLCLVLNILLISLVMSVALVFSLQWLKKLHEGIALDNSMSVRMSWLSFLGAQTFGFIAYLSFRNYFKALNSSSFFIFGFLILGFSQLIWENYRGIKSWSGEMIKTKVETMVKK